MNCAAKIGAVAGAAFGAVFAAFYSLASWLVCSGRTDCPGSWVPYLVTSMIVWAAVTLVVTGGVMAALWFYRMTKV